MSGSRKELLRSSHEEIEILEKALFKAMNYKADNVHTHTHTHIYIYIYILCHRAKRVQWLII